ncbi:MAG: hypothetical protein N2645_14025 [Clostridia bacterium]|nr:hypothetical protein [Clostridia bacterium]
MEHEFLLRFIMLLFSLAGSLLLSKYLALQPTVKEIILLTVIIVLIIIIMLLVNPKRKRKNISHTKPKRYAGKKSSHSK